MRTNEPGTTPPPSTRSSSGICVDKRWCRVAWVPDSDCGRELEKVFSLAEDGAVRAARAEILATFSSANEENEPHSGHLPSHLDDSCPHFWQM